MTTIPARLAQKTRISSSPAEARLRVLHLYRDWYRSAPDIVSLYGLNITPALIRRRIREQFEENRYVSDMPMIDRLLFKGRQEYQETMNCWKQEPHILGILLQPRERPQKTFLQRFYEASYTSIRELEKLIKDFQGRDDEGVIPAVNTEGTGL